MLFQQFCCYKKFTSRNPFFLSHVCGENDCPARHVSLVCGGFNRRLGLRPCIHRDTFRHICFSLFEKKKLYVCGGVNDFNKTYSTSAAPLLVRNRSYVCGAVARNPWNTFISQLKKRRISEVNLREVLVAPVPFIVGLVEIDIFLRCVENSRKYNEFGMLFY